MFEHVCLQDARRQHISIPSFRYLPFVMRTTLDIQVFIGGILVTEVFIRPIVSVPALTWFSRNMYYSYSLS
jgi:hypothetical protein